MKAGDALFQLGKSDFESFLSLIPCFSKEKRQLNYLGIWIITN